MTYEVEWLESALRELGAIWQAAAPPARSTLERLIARIEDRLAVAPYTQGESRPPTEFRLLFELPLRVEYRIERFTGAVVVLHVHVVVRKTTK